MSVVGNCGDHDQRADFETSPGVVKIAGVGSRWAPSLATDPRVLPAAYFVRTSTPLEIEVTCAEEDEEDNDDDDEGDEDDQEDDGFELRGTDGSSAL